MKRYIKDDNILSGFHSEDPEFSLAFEHDDWFIENKMDYANDALSALGFWSIPSTQLHQGIDEIYDSNDNLVATLDFQEELEELQNLYYQSNSEDEYISKLKQYYKHIIGV